MQPAHGWTPLHLMRKQRRKGCGTAPLMLLFVAAASFYSFSRPNLYCGRLAARMPSAADSHMSKSLTKPVTVDEPRHFTPTQYELSAKLRQEIYCKDTYPTPLPDMRVTTVGGMEVHVYQNNDVVSATLTRGNQWQPEVLSEILWALSHVVSVDGSQSEGSRGLYVDVGTHVGSFLFEIASKGYEAVAFEGMRSNQHLLRSSLCLAGKAIRSRITLHPYGAGADHRVCYLIAHDLNVGDGIPICEVSSEAQAQAKASAGYHVRGYMETLPLDWVLQRDIKVLKINVEGYESFVFEGAQQLISKHNVWFIYIKFNTVLLKSSLVGTGTEPNWHIQELARLGYLISKVSFQGPYMSQEDIDQLGTDLSHIFNLYLTRQQLDIQELKAEVHTIVEGTTRRPTCKQSETACKEGTQVDDRVTTVKSSETANIETLPVKDHIDHIDISHFQTVTGIFSI